MSIVTQFFIVVLCGIADRVRGAGEPRIPTWIEMLFYGGLISLLIHYPIDIWNLVIVVLFWAGSTTGWGHPTNQALFGDLRHDTDSKPERWQVGPLKHRPWLSLSVRGFLWGTPLLAIAYWVPAAVWVAPVFALAMPLGVLLARYQRFYRKDIWAVQEVFRGLIAGALLAVLA